MTRNSASAIPGRRVGAWSAAMLFLIGLAYLITLVAGFAVHGLSEPIVDPILAVMEVLTLLSAPPMVGLMAAIHEQAPASRKIYGTIALVFTALFAGLTSTVHFLGLTAGRQTGSGSIVWPSPAYAAELLAWDWFLGLALGFAAVTFEGKGAAGRLRRALLITGFLCLAGTIGPVVGNLRLQLVGVLGYAGLLPVVFLMLVGWFRGPGDDRPVPAE